MPKSEVFMDQGDAERAGFSWLRTLVEATSATASDEITTHPYEKTNGCTVIAWRDNRPIAIFTVVRDAFNYSILLKSNFISTNPKEKK